MLYGSDDSGLPPKLDTAAAYACFESCLKRNPDDPLATSNCYYGCMGKVANAYKSIESYDNPFWATAIPNPPGAGKQPIPPDTPTVCQNECAAHNDSSYDCYVDCMNQAGANLSHESYQRDNPYVRPLPGDPSQYNQPPAKQNACKALCINSESVADCYSDCLRRVESYSPFYSNSLSSKPNRVMWIIVLIFIVGLVFYLSQQK